MYCRAQIFVNNRSKIVLMRKWSWDWNQGMSTAIWSKIFCLPDCYRKI